MGENTNIGSEMHTDTQSALITRLGSILQTLRHEESKLTQIAKEKIEILQREIQLGDIMPF